MFCNWKGEIHCSVCKSKHKACAVRVWRESVGCSCTTIHADFNYSHAILKAQDTLHFRQVVLSLFSFFITLSSPSTLGCPHLHFNPVAEFHSTSDQRPVARCQVRLQLQPLTTTKQFFLPSFFLLWKKRGNLNKAGRTAGCVWVSRKLFSPPYSIIFLRLHSSFPKMFFPLFFFWRWSVLPSLWSPSVHCVVAGLRSSMTVNYGTLETVDQQELGNRERMHGGD